MPENAWRPWTSGRYQLAEGARWSDGRLYFVDLLQGVLHTCRPDQAGAPGRELDLGVPLGAAAPVADRPGEWIVAAGDGIARARRGTVPRWLARPEADAALPMRMNDAACDPAGRFWATSMAADATEGAGSLYRIDADGGVHHVLAGLTVPNGPAFDPAGTTLYLADSAMGTITAYTVDPGTAALGSARPFAVLDPDEGRPDGMTVDHEGRLWVAAWGAGRVRCYRPDGTLQRLVEVPTPHVSSVAFGGGRMFVTTALHGLAVPDGWAGSVLSRPSPVTAPATAVYRERCTAPPRSPNPSSPATTGPELQERTP
ncbi:SMP-30/gluconolactonase/LRE family protein [Kitasatospora sp. NPDC051853]|uniref:SMP-30/gluconolactonase/LRE family protein n=1 Tax=Kitasatospora sp. NPDC051853 TaxID=3364058 RepID=UPI00379A82AF